MDTLSGPALRTWLPALARLRCAVFAGWPYLYAGDAVHEEGYLAHYAEDPSAAIVIARYGQTPVGCATCQSMAHAHPQVPSAFNARGLDPARYCYFGESLLLPSWRGRGLGVRFFTAREAHARALGFNAAAFCAVVRNPQDPRKPSDHVPLDGFWRRRGFTHHPELSCIFDWVEIGDDHATPHVLSFWLKELA